MTNDKKKYCIDIKNDVKMSWVNLPSLAESLSLLIKGGGGLGILRKKYLYVHVLN